MLERSSVLRELCILFAFGLLALMSYTCKDTSTNPDVGIDVVFPDSNVSYGQHVDPLFRLGCAFVGCHGADTYNANGFSLDSYAHLMFGPRRPVLPGDPENSVLVWRIEGRAGTGPRMPLNRMPLNDNQIRGMRTWIQEGAQNN
jgi:hypothetical protein